MKAARFSVTVRALANEDLSKLPVSAAEVNRLGVVNYFDSQRFGSLKHGQGFIAKDLIRGDFEAALHNYMAKPSPLDRTGDAKIKAFWRENWGHWTRTPPTPGNQKYYRILRVLRDRPTDFVEAFLQIDANYRAMMLFEYQSYLWNEGVRRLLQIMLPRESLFPMPYQAGTLIFHKDADAQTLRELRELEFPLLAPDSKLENPKVKQAVEWILGKEKITLEDLRIEKSRRMLFFKHEERPVLMYPHKLVLGRPSRDELNRGSTKLNVAFTLPPGAYATLVIKRLFHFAWLGEDKYDLPEREAAAEKAEPRMAPDRKGREVREDREVRETRPASPPKKKAPRVEQKGFLERQREKKQVRTERRAEAPKPAKTKKKSTQKRR